MRFRARSAALIAVDLQLCFASPEGFVARQGRDVAACAAAAAASLLLVEAARAAAIPVIWTRMVLRNDYADGGVLISDLRPGIRVLGGLRADAPDTKLIAAARPRDGELVLDKSRNSAFFRTALDARLRARGIDTLAVCGVTTSMCVESTVRDAGQADYFTFVAPEAVGDFDQSRHDASLRAMEFGFARLVPLPALLATFASGDGEF